MQKHRACAKEVVEMRDKTLRKLLLDCADGLDATAASLGGEAEHKELDARTRCLLAVVSLLPPQAGQTWTEACSKPPEPSIDAESVRAALRLVPGLPVENIAAFTTIELAAFSVNQMHAMTEESGPLLHSCVPCSGLCVPGCAFRLPGCAFRVVRSAFRVVRSGAFQGVSFRCVFLCVPGCVFRHPVRSGVFQGVGVRRVFRLPGCAFRVVCSVFRVGFRCMCKCSVGIMYHADHDGHAAVSSQADAIVVCS
jgi:hypothetical protein